MANGFEGHLLIPQCFQATLSKMAQKQQVIYSQRVQNKKNEMIRGTLLLKHFKCRHFNQQFKTDSPFWTVQGARTQQTAVAGSQRLERPTVWSILSWVGSKMF